MDEVLMDRSATEHRLTVDAEHMQNRLRRIGRILAKVTVPAGDVIEAEVVNEAHD
ncbi:hypothetical protein ABZZ17_18695 [Streptomyces sp. NPDC006512]|uniref:hypothetical protein n=1 Tax=Streptomyces sp. NPDC006512 TaxID=3154307 RepID=UPI0033A66DA0